MTRDGLGQYLDQLSNTPLLTSEDEQRLSAAVQAGLAAKVALADNPKHPERRHLKKVVQEGNDAREQFIKANLRLVVHVARRYRWAALSLDDMVQEGTLGLMHAVEKFEWQRGYKFSTYASWWIRQSIGNAIEKTSRAIRIPGYLSDEVRRLIKTAEMMAEEGHEPTLAELAAECKISTERTEMILRADELPLSLDYEVFDNSKHPIAFADIIPDPNVDVEQEALNDLAPETENGAVRGAIEQLPPAQQQVISLMYQKGLTADEISELTGVLARSVRALESRAKNRIREMVEIA